MSELLTARDYARYARNNLQKDGELEIDYSDSMNEHETMNLVSMGDDPGAYVQCWIWVDADSVRG